jgi:hypothetical protein
MRKETVIAYFKPLSRNFSRGVQEINEQFSHHNRCSVENRTQDLLNVRQICLKFNSNVCIYLKKIALNQLTQKMLIGWHTSTAARRLSVRVAFVTFKTVKRI